jgi:AraC family transcriptional regulator
MTVRFENLPQKNLIGKRLTMSLTNNRTGELWKSFMPVRHAIKNTTGTDLFSIQIFSEIFAYDNPHAVFEKWAAIAVTDFTAIPPGMETLIIPPGRYAVFLYQGSSAQGGEAFHYIFKTWLPSTEYDIDNRPHFELLGNKYKNNDPASEEEIWIPVKHK